MFLLEFHNLLSAGKPTYVAQACIRVNSLLEQSNDSNRTNIKKMAIFEFNTLLKHPVLYMTHNNIS